MFSWLLTSLVHFWPPSVFNSGYTPMVYQYHDSVNISFTCHGYGIRKKQPLLPVDAQQ